jgi:transcriptional regulator with XRE-family HTH domain
MSFKKELEFYKFVGEKIRIARQAVGINQETLAKKVSLKRTSITNIEAGNQKVQIYMLYKIAEALRIPLASLLPYDAKKSETNKKDLLLRKKVLVDNGKKSSLSETEVEDILKVLSPRQ